MSLEVQNMTYTKPIMCPECGTEVYPEFDIYGCPCCGIFIDLHDKCCDCIDCEEQRINIEI